MDKPSKSPVKFRLTPVEAKTVKAKIKAELNDLPIIAVANEVYPNMKPESARVEVQKNLQKPTVQQALEVAMAKYGLTADTLAASVGSAMGAYKTVAVEGDLIETEVPDHGIRLKAAGMAAQWMGIGKGDVLASPSIHFHQHSNDKQSKYAD